MCCKCCSVTQRKIWVYSFGVFFTLLAIILGVLWPTLSEHILDSELVLKDGSSMYKNWLETPIPMYLEVHMFNWTNPEELENKNVKPNFVELGPYVFLEKHRRVDMDWHDENNTISFNQIRTWHFQPDKSSGSLDDMITTANVISSTVAHMVRDKPKIIKLFANILLNDHGASLSQTKTVREWLFDGFDDPLLDFLKETNSSAIKIPFSKVGWLVDRNNSKTYDGRFNMNTGKAHLTDMGTLYNWNGVNKTEFYPDECGIVNGTTGELWPTEIDTETPKTIFVTDICRFISLYPKRSVELHGIKGHQWIATERSFDNGWTYASTKCFCVKNEKGECPRPGVQDVSKCRYDAPVFASFPHFYMGDRSYIENIQGLKPNRSKHQLSLSIEPKTGIPLEVNARIQINIRLVPDDVITVFKGIRETMLPIFWFTQKANLDDNTASLTKLMLNLADIGLYVSYGLGALGVLILCIALIITFTKRWTSEDNEDEQPLSS